MIFMGVSTPQKPPREIKNSISYEILGEDFLIKIKTRINPNNYGLFGSSYLNSGFTLSFDNIEEIQEFRKDESGGLFTEIYNINDGLEILEQIIISENDISTFTEENFFVIRIRKELLKYENPKLDYIYLSSNDGKYIHEIYLK